MNISSQVLMLISRLAADEHKATLFSSAVPERGRALRRPLLSNTYVWGKKPQRTEGKRGRVINDERKRERRNKSMPSICVHAVGSKTIKLLLMRFHEMTPLARKALFIYYKFHIGKPTLLLLFILYFYFLNINLLYFIDKYFLHSIFNFHLIIIFIWNILLIRIY